MGLIMENFLLLVPRYRALFSDDVETLTIDHKIITSLKKRNEFLPGMSIVAIADYFNTSKSRIRPHESRIQQAIKYLQADQTGKEKIILKHKTENPRSLLYVALLHSDSLNTWTDLEAIRSDNMASVMKLQKQIEDSLSVWSVKRAVMI